MTGSYTRRTHIVRIAPPNADPKDPGEYVDVEVLDAIAFRIHNNKEVILKFDSKGKAYIVDNTGGNHQKEPGKASSRSHMKRIKSDDGQNALDVEVLDCWAARGINNAEWILDMQPGADGSTDYNISDGSGDSSSTRRVHTEIVTDPPGKTKADADKNYVTSIRSDNIAFRTINNHEVILSMKSCDDPHAQNVSFQRASTYTTPQGYDPNDTSDNAVKPPMLADSGDTHNYINFVDDGTGNYMPPFTQDKKIEMGPLWWIRKVSSSAGYLLFVFSGGEGDSEMVTWGDNIFFSWTPDGIDLGGEYIDNLDGTGQLIIQLDAAGNTIRYLIDDPDELSNGVTLKSSDLSGKLKSQFAGTTYKNSFAIGVQHLNVFGQIYFFLDLSNFSGSTLEFEIDTGSEQPTSYGIDMYSYKKGVVKAGAKVNDFLILKAEDTLHQDGGENDYYSLDLKTLKFTRRP